MIDGDELELLTRSKRALTQSRKNWTDKTKQRMRILFEDEPKLKKAYDIVNGLRSIFIKASIHINSVSDEPYAFGD